MAMVARAYTRLGETSAQVKKRGPRGEDTQRKPGGVLNGQGGVLGKG